MSELSLEEIEALEREVPKPRARRDHAAENRWPDQHREELMIAVIEDRSTVQLDGKGFTIRKRANRNSYIIKPVEGFAPMAEVSESWLMMS